LSKMPQQKPGKSNQSVQTPYDFMQAVHSLLGTTFAVDLAATKENAQAPTFITEEENSLTKDWDTLSPCRWLWLNPPYTHIEPWVAKCAGESACGAYIAALVPASVGANWWVNHVAGIAQVYFLNGRITFVGHKTPYPKDLALLLYRPGVTGGYSTWDWRRYLTKD
jgi:phage N-6-adenine-methyltransferase